LEKQTIAVVNPATNQEIVKVDMNTVEDLNEAVSKANKALPSWKGLTLKARAEIMYNYRDGLKQNRTVLADLIQAENGKTHGEALAEVDKAIEVTEFACSMPQIATGETLEVSRGVTCRDQLEAVGVVACITPFNFPCMVPNWTISIALVLGNAMILKPSEKVPLTALKNAEILHTAGVPKDMFQVINGDREIVEAICDHPEISAISFVGSTKIAETVYKRASQNLKQVLCLGGAKNYLIVLPDAHVDMTASNIAASFTGCAGQRCMAASVLVAVGDCESIISKVKEVSMTITPGKDLGAIITEESKNRIETLIANAERDGATVVLDGRNISMEGSYVGPTILDNVTPEMEISKEEVFGPVLCIMRVDNVEEAVSLQNQCNYGNGAGVFTQSGSLAAYVSEKLSAGMVGVNIGVPVPREPFSFGGWNASKFGTGDITGKSSIQFWSKKKKITTKWNPEDQINWMS
ncbi:CoA-acylating methylmalonate-semialdehyde dehydrogenase, partial [bacterium]|nr:CoA-acylating methylmalonate-semialdehyde dehydrogenase [bacterium]